MRLPDLFMVTASVRLGLPPLLKICEFLGCTFLDNSKKSITKIKDMDHINRIVCS